MRSNIGIGGLQKDKDAKVIVSTYTMSKKETLTA